MKTAVLHTDHCIDPHQTLWLDNHTIFAHTHADFIITDAAGSGVGYHPSY